jgi:glycosyltransferase involved in cell wall biosynthesis
LKFSIVIPTFNKQQFLDRALTSLENLDFSQSQYEVIVVDDGSTDNTRGIAEEHAGRFQHFKYIHKKNGGVASARNVGILSARGELLAFFADDYVIPSDYCSEMAKLFEDLKVQVAKPVLSTRGNLVEKAELLLYNINMLHALHEKGALPKRERLEPTLLPTEAVEFKYATEPSGAATIRRSVFERFGVFDEALQTGEDTEFGGRLGKGGIRPYLLPTIRVEVAFRNKLSKSLIRSFTYGKNLSLVHAAEGAGAKKADVFRTLKRVIPMFFYVSLICSYAPSRGDYLKLYPVIYLKMCTRAIGMMYGRRLLKSRART